MATKGSAGIRIRPDRNDPTDQEAAAATTVNAPTSGTASEPPPGSTSRTRPTKPSVTPANVQSGGRSPVAERNSTTSSGTVATSSAAIPDGTATPGGPDSASTTRPLPPASRSTPTSAAEPSCRRSTRSAPGPRRSRSTTARTRPATANRRAADSSGGSVSTAIRMAR